MKGRRFPSGDEQQQYWKNWSTRDDLRSLAAWQTHFGSGFCPLLVFAYHLVGSRSPLPSEQLFEFRGAHYGFLGVRLADYVPHARPLSDSWDTVAMPTGLFRRAARPMDDWLQAPLAPSRPRHGRLARAAGSPRMGSMTTAPLYVRKSQATAGFRNTTRFT